MGTFRSLLPLKHVGQHGARSGQLTHLAEELGLCVFTHEAGSYRHGPGYSSQRARFGGRRASADQSHQITIKRGAGRRHPRRVVKGATAVSEGPVGSYPWGS